MRDQMMTTAASLPNAELVPLAALSRELAPLINGQPPAYRRLYTMVLDARIPAQLVNGRWHVQRADLLSVCATLGLPLKAPQTAEAKPSRKAVAASTLAAA